MHGEDTRPQLRTKSLTSLRWFAALAVLFSHDAESFGALDRVATRGYLGVSFFFVLSGFILTWSARPGTTKATFWRRRFARVYPSHFVMWLAMWPLVSFLGSNNVTLESVTSLFLVQAWVPDKTVFWGWNSPAWSLACELLFYALFPFAILLLRRLTLRAGWTLVAVAWALSAAAQIGAAMHSPWLDDYAYTNPLLRLPEFLLGIVLGLTVLSGWRPRVRHTGGVALALAGVCLVVAVVDPFGPKAYVDVVAPWLFAAIIVSSLMLEQRAGAYGRFMSSRVMLALGELSFAFYLVHDKIVKGFDRQLGFPPGLPRVAVEVALSLAGAYVLNRMVERPMEVRLSGRLPAQAAQEKAAATPERAPA